MNDLTKNEILTRVSEYAKKLLNENGYDGDHYMIKVIIADLKNLKIKSHINFDNSKGHYSPGEIYAAESHIVVRTIKDFQEYMGKSDEEESSEETIH